jgi:hypothetical protein
MRPLLPSVIAGALLLVSPGAVPAEKSVRLRAQPAASSYKFEDLTITRQVAADGKPNSGIRLLFPAQSSIALCSAEKVRRGRHQPRISEVVSVSLVIHGRAVINTRTRDRDELPRVRTNQRTFPDDR